MPFERVAELQVLVEHGVALVPAELFEPGGVDALIHAGGERAAFERMSAEQLAVEASRRRPLLDDAPDRAGIDGFGTDPGEGGGPPPAEGGSQMRRNSAPSAIPAASRQRRTARTGQSSVRP